MSKEEATQSGLPSISFLASRKKEQLQSRPHVISISSCSWLSEERPTLFRAWMGALTSFKPPQRAGKCTGTMPPPPKSDRIIRRCKLNFHFPGQNQRHRRSVARLGRFDKLVTSQKLASKPNCIQIAIRECHLRTAVLLSFLTLDR